MLGIGVIYVIILDISCYGDIANPLWVYDILELKSMPDFHSLTIEASLKELKTSAKGT